MRHREVLVEVPDTGVKIARREARAVEGSHRGKQACFCILRHEPAAQPLGLGG